MAVLISSLCGIFNKSLSSGILPPGFKEAKIIPIHKKEDKESVTNYRPVSLLSCASNVMERCVLNKIYPILKNQIYYLQHGFIKGEIMHYSDGITSLGESAGLLWSN